MIPWLRALCRSFYWAGRGIWRAMGTGRNLRIHLVAACYLTGLGLLAALDGTRWAALLLCFGAVISAELLNTALEQICDALHPQQHPKIGAAKDAAAGAVLVLALASVGVGIALLGPWLLGGGLMAAQENLPWLLPVFLISLVPAALFIAAKNKN